MIGEVRDVSGGESQRPLDGVERHGKSDPADLDRERCDRRDRDGDRQFDGRSPPRLARELHVSLELADRRPQNVESDASPRYVGHVVGRGHAILEREHQHLVAPHGGALPRRRHPTSDGRAQEGLCVDAAAVVAADEGDPVATPDDLEDDAARGRLSRAPALRLRFDPMGHRVSHHVQERVAKREEDARLQTALSADGFEDD